MWARAFVDQAVTKKVALRFDGSWRRMDFGQAPQQLQLNHPAGEVAFSHCYRLK